MLTLNLLQSIQLIILTFSSFFLFFNHCRFAKIASRWKYNWFGWRYRWVQISQCDEILRKRYFAFVSWIKAHQFDSNRIVIPSGGMSHIFRLRKCNYLQIIIIYIKLKCFLIFDSWCFCLEIIFGQITNLRKLYRKQSHWIRYFTMRWTVWQFTWWNHVQRRKSL